MTEAEQLSIALAPEAPPDLEMREYHPDELTAKDIPKPGAALKRNIAAWGVLQPVLVHRNGDDKLVVVDGNRRTLAARAADVMVPCVVTANLGYLKHVATMMLNSLHERNLIAEMESIDALLDEGATVESIANMTGTSKATVEKRLKLRNLNPTIRQMVVDGKIANGIAERVAKLSKPEQERLLEETKKDDGTPGRITADDIKDLRRAVSQQTAMTELGDLFAEAPAITPEQVEEYRDVRLRVFVSSVRRDGIALKDITAQIKKEWAAQEKGDITS